MNLTGLPPHKKGYVRKSRTVARDANAEEKQYWHQLIKLGCMVASFGGCKGRTTIHHCGTGAGGRKDHMKVIGLCVEHHLGPEGIDGRRMSKKAWQVKYETETVLLARVKHKMEKGEGDE